MKLLITNPFIVLFIILPPLLLFIKQKYFPKLNIFLVILLQMFLGWLFVNGGNYYYGYQLENELKKYNYDLYAEHDPNEKLSPEAESILQKLNSDGGRNAFTFLFGWLYALIYFIPYLILFLVVNYFKKKRGFNATSYNTGYTAQ